MSSAKIKEIFTSIQGEGPVVGYKQLFIRFCDCNLNCKYCDTDFESVNSSEYSAKDLAKKIEQDFDLNQIHSISLTGGEPLKSVEFLEEFLPLIQGKTKIYLETNATMSEQLLKIKKYIDIISADIKLKSSSGLDTTNLHSEFFKNCVGVETFAKVVFDENIADSEISECINLAEKNNLEIILQPKMCGDKMSVSSEFCEGILDRFLSRYKNCRLIPQVHKFINVR